MELSGKQKPFLQFFFSFSQSSLNLKHFRKNNDSIADPFRILRTPKNKVRSIPKKSRFRESVEKQQGKCAQTLFKYERQPIYYTY